jgi:hypothetical protein
VPIQKDLKKLVRARMEKTGEAYTAARLQLLNKQQPPQPDYASLAGMSDPTISKRTGRTWAEWVRVLDARKASEQPHRAIVEYVSSLGTPDWWSQTVTVGYERIRGLRDRGQRRGGSYEASKSRTFAVPVETLFDAMHNARIRKRWLPVKVDVRSATAPKRMRITWDDATQVQVGFYPKGAAKSSIAVQHEKLPDRASIDVVKAKWTEYFDRLEKVLS